MNKPGIRRYLLLASLAIVTAPAAANDYETQRDDAIRKCRATAPKDYQTGLLMNPAGYRSY